MKNKSSLKGNSEIINNPENINKMSNNPMSDYGFRGEYLEMIESGEWKEKVKGMELIWDKNRERVKQYLKEYMLYLKGKLKEWKETNVKVIQEVYKVVLEVTKERKVNREEAEVIGDLLIEKLGDTKYADSN
jgi:hypothetical protein